eukprot:TRINITY_DN2955_c0_g1_i1.p1 TRINITY_DN2955_c0_g1~~TRINITY_DN2955_c0_g1_i1.p1  ORF type:complete len:112 (+),score=42.78 TRINITY_DN2955_c0_g1_i1:12-347(+)
MIRQPPRSTLSSSSAASDVYKRQESGTQASVICNKIKGIRAAFCHNSYGSTMTRKHNDSNILIISCITTGPDVSTFIIPGFLENNLCDPLGYHQNRINLMTQIEQGKYKLK